MSRSIVAQHEAQVRLWLLRGESYRAIGARLGVSDVAVRKQVTSWGMESKYSHGSVIRISKNPPRRRPADACIVCHRRPKADRGCCSDPNCQEVWHWFLSGGGPGQGAPHNRSDLIGLYAITRYIECHASTQPNR